jgi:SAM-dependent methyltransferase
MGPFFGISDRDKGMVVDRKKAREIAGEHLQRGDPLGWFEALYAFAGGNADIIPWADRMPNPKLVQWLDKKKIKGSGKRAIKVGCGLGDDAEELACRGFDVIAFDISPTAIAWCRERFPNSCVRYEVADLFDSPKSWTHAFDLVVESYTLQVLPPAHRIRAIEHISRYVDHGGTLLVISRGRAPQEDTGELPWPITRDELEQFELHGLKLVCFEDFVDDEDPPVRRFRAQYQAPA